VSYTSPSRNSVSASRIARSLPNARLICILRHPLVRIRSHYRHQVQRGRETRSFAQAIEEPGSGYVRQSLYFRCLEPYVQTFSREQICIVRFEDLIADPPVAWYRVLEHLDVPGREPPASAENVTGEKPGYTRAMLWLWESGILNSLRRVPRPIRRVGKRLLTRHDSSYRSRLERASEAFPDGVASRVWEDVGKLELWFDGGSHMWERQHAPQMD
jgi:hypothetical protein